MPQDSKPEPCTACNRENICKTIADWAGVPVSTITENTQLNGLGGKTFPDIALAEDLAELCPLHSSAIMENYPTWSIVQDAEDDCL